MAEAARVPFVWGGPTMDAYTRVIAFQNAMLSALKSAAINTSVLRPLVEFLARWVVVGGDDADSENDLRTMLQTQATQKKTPFFVACCAMGTEMPRRKAEKFMAVATELFCSPAYIGLVVRDSVQHNILKRVFRDFDVATLFPKPLHDTFVLAATRSTNFHLFHEAVQRGRIDVPSCASLDGSSGRDTFLCHLSDLDDKMFEVVLNEWLPLCTYDHALHALNSFAAETCRRTQTYYFTEKKCLMLLNATLGMPSEDVGVMAIQFNFLDLFKSVLQRAHYAPGALKRLVQAAAVTSLPILGVLLDKHPWLGKTHVNEEDALLHYSLRLGRLHFQRVLNMPVLRENLEVLDRRGRTPLMRAFSEGMSDKVLELLYAGANLAFHHRKDGTVYHMQARQCSEQVWCELMDWARRNVSRMKRFPSVEARTKDGRMTALQTAFMFGNYRFAKYLIWNGANVNTRYGKYENLNTADYLFLKGDREGLRLLHRARRVEADPKRVLHHLLENRIYDAKLDFKILPSWRHFHERCLKPPEILSKKAIVYLLRGLDGEFVCKNSRKARPGDSDKCSICLGELKRYHTTVCKHKFHGHCLADWMGYREEVVCPNCRGQLQEYPLRCKRPKAMPPLEPLPVIPEDEEKEEEEEEEEKEKYSCIEEPTRVEVRDSDAESSVYFFEMSEGVLIDERFL